MASQPHPILSFEQYIALERELGCKFEYYCGQAFAMSGGSPAHSTIQMNLAAALVPRLAVTACQAHSSDLKLFVEASGLYTYPDASIFCGPLQIVRGSAATNPKAVIEVLSPSTRKYDCVGKFLHYRLIPSLEEYVLVEQDTPEINVWRRMPNGEWESSSYRGEDAVLELVSVGLAVPLREIYARVPFELAEREPERP